MTKNQMALTLQVLALAALVGCVGEPEEESADVEACEHLQNGPAKGAAASESAPPLVDDDHSRYDIELVDLPSGGKGGSVQFAVAEASDYYVFLDADVPLVVRDGSGQQVDAEEKVTSSELCTEIAARHLVPLEVGTYTFSFGPSEVSEVSLVVEAAAHDAEHAH